MNTGPTDGAVHCPLRSPIALENRIQLPSTLSLQEKNLPEHPLFAPRPVSSPDHISYSPIRPPAANPGLDLTPVTCLHL
ncbi:hypothetical protein NQZ68_014809 [Dissostichus eleginoides]|nr:hypothetical protein NQZ68_014809 [Dissostichus eleginoides]